MKTKYKIKNSNVSEAKSLPLQPSFRLQQKFDGGQQRCSKKYAPNPASGARVLV